MFCSVQYDITLLIDVLALQCMQTSIYSYVTYEVGVVCVCACDDVTRYGTTHAKII